MKYQFDCLGELDIDKEKDLELEEDDGKEIFYAVTNKNILQYINDAVKNAISVNYAGFVQSYNGEQCIVVGIDVDRRFPCFSDVDDSTCFDVLWPNTESKMSKKLTLTELKELIQDREDLEYFLNDTLPARPFAFVLRFDKMKVPCLSGAYDVLLESASSNVRISNIECALVDTLSTDERYTEMYIKLIGENGQEYDIMARSREEGVSNAGTEQ